MKALPPAYLTGGIEPPLGTKDMGSFTRKVYTPEQQARLSVSENGKKIKKNTRTDWSNHLFELAFTNFDENNDGTVTAEEFCDFANTLGGLGHMTNEQVSIMIAAVDLNNDGVLQVGEFKVLMKSVLADKADKADNDFFLEHFLTKRQAREFLVKKGNSANA